MIKIKKLFIIVIAIIISIVIFTNSKSGLDKVLAKGNYVIIDVRTHDEYATSHVKGSINIPYDQIDRNTKLDKNKTILVYCKSGVRSNKAYNTLKNLGYDVVDLGAYDNIDLEKE